MTEPRTDRPSEGAATARLSVEERINNCLPGSTMATSLNWAVPLACVSRFAATTSR